MKKQNTERAAAGSPDPQEEPRRIKRSAGLTEEVYQRIRADIMSLRIPPDTRIMVDNLARELGVSQTPIREALSMLEAIGLVTKRHFIGYCTAPKFNREQYNKLFEVRLLLEPHAARRAAQNMGTKSIAELGGLMGRMESESAAGATGSYEAFADQDAEFHAQIANGGDNILIAEALARLHTHLHVFRLGVPAEYAAEAMVEHNRISKALADHDPDGAEEAMRAHLMNSFKRLIPFMGE